MSGNPRKIIKQFTLAVILSLYPVWFLYSENIQRLYFRQTFTPALIIIVFAAFFFCLLKFISTSKFKVSNIEIVVPLVSIILFTYGHIFNTLRSQSASLGSLVHHRYIIIIYLVVILFVIYMFSKLETGNRVSSVLLLFLIVLNVFPFVSIVSYKLKFTSHNVQVSSFSAISPPDGNSHDPDIFYIILDMYPSEKVFAEILRYNNKPFIDSLIKLGFFVQPDAKSNYPRTLLSLASSLNMEYIHDEKNLINREITMEGINSKLQNNKVSQFLKNRGYTYYLFDGGYGLKFQYDKNEKLISLKKSFLRRLNLNTADNDFLGLFVNTSILQIVEYKLTFASAKTHRQQIKNVINILPKLANQPDKKFVFAHIMSPHPPFVFGKDGEDVNIISHATINRKIPFLNQVTYINREIISLLKKMIAIKNEREKVIILQGDHGSRVLPTINKYDKNQKWIMEQFGILNAVYRTDSNYFTLAKEFSKNTPVNTFRKIFNSYFSSNIPVLPDRQYYTDFSTPLKFIQVE
ncbi:MAG: sulfatase-like hydrolase/transferase [Ginsengibacter sp.]